MEVYKEFFVLPVDYKKTIAFVSTENVKDSWTFDVNWDFALNEKKPKMFLDSENLNENEGDNVKNQKETEDLTLQTLIISEFANLLSFTTSDKSLFLCRIDGRFVVTLSRRLFLRTSSVIRFSKDGRLLFLADKTGDVFEYSCEDVNKPARWIFGHISQILDLQVKSDLSYIVTSDRDEKIRVTCHPATHEIESFCVGHKEFVSSLAFFNREQLLLSASGDKTLRFWNFQNGKQIQKIDLDFVPITVALSEADGGQGFIAVSSDDNTLYVYSYFISNPVDVKLSLLGQKTYPCHFDFVVRDNKFFIKHINDVEGARKLLVDKITPTEDSVNFELACNITDAIGISLDSAFRIFQPFDVSLLFKKKYDNVKQYIDRKKVRIEGQLSKKQ